MLAFEHEGHEGFFERIERISRFTKTFHLEEHAEQITRGLFLTLGSFNYLPLPLYAVSQSFMTGS